MNNEILISVIITTKNEEKNIENCLKSIFEQSYPQDKIEIIIVDNNSTDNTKKIAENFKNVIPAKAGIQSSFSLKVFNYGPERSAQRNFGVEKSSGVYFLYLDADMVLHKDVIRDCVITIQNTNIIGLYISEIVMGEKFFSKVRRFERSFYDATVIDCVRFIKKEAFKKVGGFDEKFTGPEDWDLDKKLRKEGNVDLIRTPIYHNEAEFDLKKYLSKKGYYAKTMDKYIAKWGKNDKDIQKQFGFYYRFIGVFIENGKWKKIIFHPILFGGVMALRFLVGLKFITRRN